MPTPSLQLLGALRRITQSLDTYSKAIEHSAGMTLPQLLVLEALRDDDTLSAGRLAERVSLTQGTVTSILDRLESRGWIERVRATEDRRRVMVALTQAGRERLQAAPSLMRDEVMQEFARMDDDERQALLDAVERVAALMRKAAAPEEYSPEMTIMG